MNAATLTSNIPEQGQLVQVRSRQWVVNEVKPTTVPPPALNRASNGSQKPLLTLSLVEDDGLGEELQVVWEIEPGTRVIKEALSNLEPLGLGLGRVWGTDWLAGQANRDPNQSPRQRICPAD